MNGPATHNSLDLSAFQGRDIAVLGLGVSGRSAATALHQAGAGVMAWDDSAERRNAISAVGLEPVNLMDVDFSTVDELVLSPGIPHGHPHSHPIIERARAAGCRLVCDLELLTRTERDARHIGITGTNGKSTTTALIGHILSETGIANAVGGNIGAPGLDLPAMGASGVYVLEVSSYQLELMPAAVFDVAILLNITPDHLDRHGGIDGYVAAKRQIFRGQRAGDTAIIRVDDKPSKAIFEELYRSSEATVVPISTRDIYPGGVYVDKGWLVDARHSDAQPVLELSSLETLPGVHNAQNVAAAYAASTVIAGTDREASQRAIIAAIRSFAGLVHRQELVGYRNAVRFVNDSKATNAEAAAHALAAYDNIIWIAGGIAKEGGIASLDGLFDRIRHAYLIGTAAKDFAETLKGRVSATISSDLETAVADAVRLAGDGPATILLAPACASFDQFTSFEARGDAFKAAVAALEGFAPRRPGEAS